MPETTFLPNTGGVFGYSATTDPDYDQSTHSLASISLDSITSPLWVASASGATVDVLQINVSGDTNRRLAVRGDGRLTWGTGSGAGDSILTRSGVGELTLTSNLVMGGLTASSVAAASFAGAGAGGSPAASAFGDTASNGSGTALALSNHRHAREAGIALQDGGSAIGIRPTLNFIDGINVYPLVVDNSGSNKVDVTINGPTFVSDSAAASASLTLTTSFADVVGATLTVGSWARTATILVVAAVDFLKGTGDGDCSAQLDVAGTPQSGAAIFNGAAGERCTCYQSWVLTVPAATSQTIKIQAKKATGAGASTANLTNTTIRYFGYY